MLLGVRSALANPRTTSAELDVYSGAPGSRLRAPGSGLRTLARSRSSQSPKPKARSPPAIDCWLSALSCRLSAVRSSLVTAPIAEVAENRGERPQRISGGAEHDDGILVARVRAERPYGVPCAVHHWPHQSAAGRLLPGSGLWALRSELWLARTVAAARRPSRRALGTADRAHQQTPPRHTRSRPRPACCRSSGSGPARVTAEPPPDAPSAPAARR